MTRNKTSADLWNEQGAMWRRPAQVIGAWWDAPEPDPRTLEFKTRGPWWNLLQEAGITLLVTREYEHLVIAMSAGIGRGRISYLPLPHPSGLAVDRENGKVFIASTRNPNQIIELQTLKKHLPRRGVSSTANPAKMLVPRRSWFYPGSLYLHDLALIGGNLHGTAVGSNTILRFNEGGTYSRVWWPQSLETLGAKRFDCNYLQLNSIAAGKDLNFSFFSASAEMPSARRPGHQNFPVDKRGVIFHGKTRQPMCSGLTRPHSAKIHREQVWVDNSGYGEVGFAENGHFTVAAKLPGWTRGLCFHKNIAFVGTSQVLPRFQHYAPGLAIKKCVCAVHAVDTLTGNVLASIQWPYGNQIFAIEWLPASQIDSLPFQRGWGQVSKKHAQLFFTYDAGHLQES